MKSVLISIQPKWVEKIASGQKTIEVRKTRPKLKTPFKVYIYCSKYKYHYIYDLRQSTNGEFSLSLTHYNKTSLIPQNYWNGKVIGEFICDEVKYISPTYGYVDARCEGGSGYILDKCCLTAKQFVDYGDGKTLYGWHISNLVIYDKPKELFDFANYNKYQVCKEKNCFSDVCWVCPNNAIMIRPPQSWCYVEDI